jgi:hypothetical protein
MNVDNLKPGTKLIWDALEPFEGYSLLHKNMYQKEGRVYYPCVVTNRKSNNSALKCHVQTAGGTFHWMSGEHEYLRLPTNEELETLEFPNPKNYD